VLKPKAAELADLLSKELNREPHLRQQILSIGVPILLSDGKRLMRGPRIKAVEAEQGWVDLTSTNMARWQERLAVLQASIKQVLSGDSSSRFDRAYPAARHWGDGDDLDVGEIAGWLFIHEDRGRRGKA
jgi:hypothetical protein